MKQLLIVKSTETALRTTMQDIIANPGSLGLFKLSDGSAMSSLDENFSISLGRPNGQMPFTISEVDVETLQYEKATPSDATTFEVLFVMPETTEIGEEYTVVLAKKGTVPHERNTWTYTHMAKTEDGEDETEAFVNEMNSKFQMMATPFVAEADGLKITISCTNPGEAYTARFADRLIDTKVTEFGPDDSPETPSEGNATVIIGTKAILDKTYVQDLASRCAAGKGFTETYRADRDVLPGYPETVEDTTYVLYTLRFKVGRDSAKTRDERVWQLVHIAVPKGSTTVVDALDGIFA